MTDEQQQQQKKYEKMSKAELISELKELQRYFDFVDYDSWYTEGYWLNFVIDLIVDEKIDSRYWAKRMPQVNPYPALIEKFMERLENKYLNLTDAELEKANKQKVEDEDGPKPFNNDTLKELLKGRKGEMH